MAFELPTRSRWIDGHGAEFFVRDLAVRRALYFSAETFHQFGRTLLRVHRVTTQTRPVTAVQRLTGSREKIDVLARRFFCRTGRPTKNSRGANTDVEDSFEGGIARDQCAIHCLWRRQKFRLFHIHSLEGMMAVTHPRKSGNEFPSAISASPAKRPLPFQR